MIYTAFAAHLGSSTIRFQVIGTWLNPRRGSLLIDAVFVQEILHARLQINYIPGPPTSNRIKKAERSSSDPGSFAKSW